MSDALVNDTAWMQRALVEARAAAALDEVPVGALVVCNEELIAVGHNCRETSRDPLAHAELFSKLRLSQAHLLAQTLDEFSVP